LYIELGDETTTTKPTGDNTMKKAEYIAYCNKMRKAHRNQWCSFTLIVDGIAVGIKFYNTWIQVISVDGIHSSGTMDCSVKCFNEDLNKALQ